MEMKTIEDFDRAVEALLNWAMNNAQLIETLKSCRDHSVRWMTLEKAVIETLPVQNVNLGDFHPIITINRIRDMFFYQMQQKTGMDFGFCEYFEPHWRNTQEYFLSGCKTNPQDNWNLCRYDGEPIWTTCEGTDTHVCHVLPESKRKNVVVDDLYAKMFMGVNIALEEASERMAQLN